MPYKIGDTLEIIDSHYYPNPLKSVGKITEIKGNRVVLKHKEGWLLSYDISNDFYKITKID